MTSGLSHALWRVLIVLMLCDGIALYIGLAKRSPTFGEGFVVFSDNAFLQVFGLCVLLAALRKVCKTPSRGAGLA